MGRQLEATFGRQAGRQYRWHMRAARVRSLR